jgi:hypothetical protein
MRKNILKRPDASDTRVGDLIFEARQRLSWYHYYLREGKPGAAQIHLKKHQAAIKSLETLGVRLEVNEWGS